MTVDNIYKVSKVSKAETAVYWLLLLVALMMR